jgi:hypothetical protein
MRLSDEIAQHVVRHHFVPAWRADQQRLTLRAGNIHRELKLTQRMPAVCSVLGSNRFHRMARVQLVDRRGPQNGANAIFVFEMQHARRL